ncbi:AAA family ATPase [Agromyces endophyticus]|uniref:ATP-binding protein n=1 Tax=Agromyces sp. H17E-10 TaxID=2932244 RepID=UPI001FD38AC3|nr:helix-turn-helix transcriptional regulator [Agromyces sp. H17E-10]UOQ88022.1 AAA family ATPase [Agromyces sp. H17E-10]
MQAWSIPALPPGWMSTGAPPFVARRAELRALHAAYTDVESGAGRTVFVSGDPGTGKSRLLGSIGGALRALGAAVLYGDCIQEFGRPLEPFDHALAPLLAALEAAGAVGAAGSARSAGSAGSVGSAGGEPAPDEDAAFRVVRDRFAAREGTGVPSIGPDRLFDAVVDVLVAASRTRPIVLALDDLHWAGDDAVKLLLRIIVGTTDARVLVIAALRPAPPDRSEPLSAIIRHVAHLPSVEQVSLSPFTAADLTEYLEAGGVPADEARASALAVEEATGGNPFLVRTTWRHVLEAWAAHDRRVEVPESAFELLRPRIAMLTTDELAVLRVAALLGHEVDLVELLAVSDTSQADALAAIDASVHAGLLEPPAGPADPYAFPHAIARQAVLDGLTPSEAMRIHARIAQTLEAQFPSATRRVQRLAHHYLSARALGFGARAVEYLVRSAESARLRLAHEEAGRLFEQAADVTSRADERDALRLRSAESWEDASDFARARAQYERMMEASDPRQRLRAAIGYEDASWRPGLGGRRSRDLLTRALAGVPDDDHDPLVIHGRASLGRAIAFTGDLATAATTGDRAIALARELGDEQALAAALRARVSQTLRPEGVHDRLVEVDELAPLVEGMNNDWSGICAIASSWGGYVIGDGTRIDLAESALAATAERWGAYWNYWAECARFGRAFADGRLADANASLHRLGVIEQGFLSDATPGVGAVQGFMLRRETGRLGIAAATLTGEEQPTRSWAPGLLALYTELDMLEPSRRVLRWMLEHDEPAAHVSSDWPIRLIAMCEAALALHDRDAAAKLRPLLHEYSGFNLLSGFYVAQFGPADRYLGELDALCATGDPAALFGRAIALAEQLQAPLHIAYAEASAAAHFRRTGDTGSAEASAARARTIAEPLGLGRVLKLLPEASATTNLGGLTARETEVLRLVADGLSNREIAAELVISEHTAANHVRSILSKVGAPNRTRAARFAREQGLA